MANRSLTKDVSDNILAAAALADFFGNKRNRFIENHADHDKVIFKGSNEIPLKIGDNWYFTDTDVNISTGADIDTGAVANGKDYYVYACNTAGTLSFKVSLNSTNPTGFTAANSRKLGGFHTLCADVGVIAGHPGTGFTANDIIPVTIWDLKHRPISEPEGMFYDEGTDLWVDIYLASGTGASCASVNGATITDTRNWMDFVDDGHAVKKQLLTDSQFQSAAAGSNEETNIAGSADPTTTGGHSDTAARRMLSHLFMEDGCGALYQWLNEQSAMYDDSIAAGWYDLDGAKGSLYRPVDTNDVKLPAGGDWAEAASCGSRCRGASYFRWHTASYLGARFGAKPQ